LKAPFGVVRFAGASKIKIKFADGFVRWQYDGYNIGGIK